MDCINIQKHLFKGERRGVFIYKGKGYLEKWRGQISSGVYSITSEMEQFNAEHILSIVLVVVFLLWRSLEMTCKSMPDFSDSSLREMSCSARYANKRLKQIICTPQWTFRESLLSVLLPISSCTFGLFSLLSSSPLFPSP